MCCTCGQDNRLSKRQLLSLLQSFFGGVESTAGKVDELGAFFGLQSSDEKRLWLHKVT